MYQIVGVCLLLWKTQIHGKQICQRIFNALVVVAHDSWGMNANCHLIKDDFKDSKLFRKTFTVAESKTVGKKKKKQKMNSALG